MSLTIAQLQLGPMALQAATLLLSEFGPTVIQFRSGYRNLETQAHDMAANVRRNKEWIKDTYTRQDRPSYAVACRLQEAVYLHSEVNDPTEIAAYLYDALQQIPDAEAISFHLQTRNGVPAAEAFDLQPVEDAYGQVTTIGSTVVSRIHRLPHLDTFLWREGGLRIWHCQFLQQSVLA